VIRLGRRGGHHPETLRILKLVIKKQEAVEEGEGIEFKSGESRKKATSKGRGRKGKRRGENLPLQFKYALREGEKNPRINRAVSKKKGFSI